MKYEQPFITIDFQEGPIKEVGVNGTQTPAVIDILIEELLRFQLGEFSCLENASAITHLHEAKFWLEHRTKLRKEQEVEGYNKKHDS